MGLVAGFACPRDLAIVAAAPRGTPRHVRFRTIHHFSGLDGAEPRAGLIRGSDGQAYGTTNAGGEHGLGVVYRLTRDHRIKVVHSFAGGAQDGATPFTSSVVEADGALYGTTYRGGGIDEGVAYRLESDIGMTILHDFGIPFRAAQSGDLMLASDGNFYGASESGGQHDSGAVFRMDKEGFVTILWSLGKGRDPEMPLAGPIEAMDGRLYGTSSEGGIYGVGGTVYSLLKDGTDRRVLHSFRGNDVEGSSPVDAVTQGADGALYGVTEGGGDFKGGTVFRLGLDGAYEVLHSLGGDGDGSSPHTPLLEHRPGVFIGATRFGGKAGGGVVYQIHADGRYRVLHHFGGDSQGAPDGHEPWGALRTIAPGHILGTCLGGGSFGLGTVWSLQADVA
jgi:uncharacterized repeat protein (TIGR03803 family)